jgi:gamma-glutamylcyclotransferase (GGCT)/AIG2-like uncharacterized protein YtfP
VPAVLAYTPLLAPSFSIHQHLHHSAFIPRILADFVFFYGTLMDGFDRRRRAGIDGKLRYVGRGSITAALFDLGIYPAAVPSADGRVWGEVYEMLEPDAVLAALDDIEGYRLDDPDKSLYARAKAGVTMPDGTLERAWVYFYNAPLGRAERIDSGDYLEHLKVR